MKVKVTHKVKVPVNTCHPGENVEFRTQAKPYPTWNCAKCGNLISVEKNPPTITPN